MKESKLNIDYYREKILFLLKNKKENYAKNLIYKVAKDRYIKYNDVLWLYNFFSPIYDELFYDIMLERIKIKQSTKMLLEKLSMPLFKMSEIQKKSILNDIKNRNL